VVHQRGWVGGEYAQAKAASWRPARPEAGPTVYAFPRELRKLQSSGVLVSAVFSNTPAALAGLQPGDLILRVDDRPTPTVKSFRKAIDACEPGVRARFSVYRGGRLEDRDVRVGREEFANWNSVSINLGLSSHLDLDLVPDPEFSFGALGYRRNRDRAELHSPQTEFARAAQAQPGQTPPAGWDSAEGWHTWLTVLNFSGYRRILSQETVGEPVPGDGYAPRRAPLKPDCRPERGQSRTTPHAWTDRTGRQRIVRD